MVEGEIARVAAEFPEDELVVACGKLAHDVVRNEIRTTMASANGCLLERGEESTDLIPFSGGADIKNTSRCSLRTFRASPWGTLRVQPEQRKITMGIGLSVKLEVHGMYVILAGKNFGTLGYVEA